MKQYKEGSNLWYALWREKDGWKYKVERRGANPQKWEGTSFEGKDTAEMAMNEKLRGIAGMDK